MQGSTLGEFEIDGILGEGGSSVVYAARWGAREIALKVIQAEGPVTDADRTRFLAEAERMQRVVHSSLISLLGAGFLPDGRPYIAMPRLRGRTLADHSAPIAIEQALALFEDVVHGVSALHAAGLVHRDIKPQNIMWVEPEDRLVLLDLGIAREIDASPSTTTRAGFSRGTPAYMAPERLFGQSATLRSDLYELALVLVVMLLGRLPWEEGDPQGRMLPDLSASGPNGALIPQALAPTLARALSLDVERRPSSANELLAWLVEAHPTTQRRFNLATAPTVLHQTPQSASRPAFAVSGFPMSLPQPERATPPGSFITQPATPIQRAALVPSTPPTAAASKSNLLPFAAIGVTLALASGAAALLVRARSPEPPASSSATGANAAPNAAASASTAAETTSAPSPTAAQGFGPAGPSASVAASASPSAVASASSSSSGSPTKPSTAPAVTTTSSAPKPSATSSPSAAPVAMSAACASYVALMCSPSSGASALECSHAKSNAASWSAKLPADVARDTCQSALNASQIGLAGRKEWQPP